MSVVKICGNTNIDDAMLAKDLGAQYLGLIFAVSKRQISVEKAQEIKTALPDYKNFVGVFMDQPQDEVLKIVSTLELSWVQFHGSESPEYCQSFMDQGYQVIKSIPMQNQNSLDAIQNYQVPYFLLDSVKEGKSGGTGERFDWALAEKNPVISKQGFLAGGLDAKNVFEAIRKVQPYGVDVASGVEAEPGIKDPEKLRAFMMAVQREELSR